MEIHRNETKYGVFKVDEYEQPGGNLYYRISIDSGDDPYLLAYIFRPSESTLSIKSTEKIIDMFIDIFSFEESVSGFYQLGENLFKAATIRNLTEQSGLTPEIRKMTKMVPDPFIIIDGKYTKAKQLIQFTDLDKMIGISTPYGTFSLDWNCEMFLDGVSIGYVSADTVTTDEDTMMIDLAVENIGLFIEDIKNLKKRDVSKRISNAVQSILGLDDLRDRLVRRSLNE